MLYRKIAVFLKRNNYRIDRIGFADPNQKGRNEKTDANRGVLTNRFLGGNPEIGWKAKLPQPQDEIGWSVEGKRELERGAQRLAPGGRRGKARASPGAKRHLAESQT